MSYGRKTLYLVVVCGVSSFLMFILFPGRPSTKTAESPQLFVVSRQTHQTAEATQEIPTPAIAPSSAFHQKNLIIQPEPDRVARLEKALQSKDETAIKIVVAKMDNCPQCLERIAAFLDDPSEAVADKIILGKILIQSGTQAETLLVVNAILSAHLREEGDLKDGLLQALADTQTPESVAALTAVVTRDSANLDFPQLPEELQYAIQKAIRLNPNTEVTGQMLAATYNRQVSSEIAQDIENVQHPLMVSLLAKEAHHSGDIARVEHFMHLLSTMDDPRTLDALMLLGENNVMSLDEANERAYAWVSEHGGSFDHEHYAAYLSDLDSNAAQRSVAAFALAASRDVERARGAVEKALDYESDPRVRSHLEAALKLLLDRSNPK